VFLNFLAIKPAMYSKASSVVSSDFASDVSETPDDENELPVTQLKL
jgi:hypothetical protein